MKTNIIFSLLMAASLFSLSLVATNSVRDTQEEQVAYCVSDDMRTVANDQFTLRGPHW